ncbi:hypothetical protein OM076_23550 [Solirubrobacter ginsenosidimutans]|uniref:Uncharacterized protein n=1 Tax=Solirubrobacter ginsenosidimutans TaxID=490573 RepID=A0A9X3MVF2_9ACTN|nr:hypothetical protein [Solirubrobacter ginsenosidimutans]MDA0163270.1 hypothetical protein [Solirubrobacter ginsenosidimutans]
MSVRGAAVLGIGSMVGAGIFGVLDVRFPSSGGLIEYLVAGFGDGRLVGIAGYRPRADPEANIVIALAAIVVLAFFAVDTLRNDPMTFVAILALTVLAVVLERTWKGTPAEAGAPAADAEAVERFIQTG